MGGSSGAALTGSSGAALTGVGVSVLTGVAGSSGAGSSGAALTGVGGSSGIPLNCGWLNVGSSSSMLSSGAGEPGAAWLHSQDFVCEATPTTIGLIGKGFSPLFFHE